MFEIDKKEFGSFLSELRKEKGFTQKELADALMNTVIQMTDEERAAADRARKKIQTWFIVAAVVSLVACLGIYQYFSQARSINPMAVPMPLMFSIFGLFFGIYACFSAKEKLPSYFDENQISAMSDGMFRMNLPGVHFNNSNWKHILGWMRIWSVLMLLIGPVVWFVACWFSQSMEWTVVYAASSGVTAAVLLVSVFIPIYVLAKKYE